MKFSFSTSDISNWKGKIAERLADSYIQKELTPRLEREGFTRVFKINPEKDFFPISLPLSLPVRRLLKGKEVSRKSWERRAKECEIEVREGGQSRVLEGKEKVDDVIRRDKSDARELPEKTKRICLTHGVYPLSELLDRIINLLCILDVWTDGILFKTRETGKTISEKEACKSNFFADSDNHQGDEEFPIVNGELEIIEVKLGKAYLPSHQVENYAEVVGKGYPLRFFHVDIISFEKNKFEIKERLITNPNEIKSRIRF